MRYAVGCVGAVVLALFVGCTTTTAPQPASPPTPPPATAPTPPKAPPVDLDKLDALLEQGDRALKDGRLLTPIDNCAYDYYREALVVAPDHPAALHGLERVAERYVSMAEQAASHEQYDKARQLLERARVVDPDLQSIATVQAQIQMRSAAGREHTNVDSGQLAGRSNDLSTQLKTLGSRAKAQDSWVVIRAPTDADGRWIYQQMAAGSGERRIRAELTLGAPPAVDLLNIAPNAEANAAAGDDGEAKQTP
jgi:hypothetical protein